MTNGNGNGLSTLDIRDAGLPARAINALKEIDKFKTVGELVKAADEELLNVPKLGRKTIEQVRARIAALRMAAADQFAGKEPETVMGLEPTRRQPTVETGPEVDWARSHANLIRAIQAGEVIIRVRA
jgi:hypothetical protein